MYLIDDFLILPVFILSNVAGKKIKISAHKIITVSYPVKIQGNIYVIRRFRASSYFSLVFCIIWSGNFGAGGF